MRCELKQVKLGDVATVKGGKRLPQNVNLINTPNTHPYIRVRDLNDRVTLELNDSFLYVDDETQKGISRYVVNSDDIVISIVGTIGLVAKIGKTLDGANLTENCVKIANLQNIDKEYLFYYLKSVFGQQEIMRGIVGAVQQKLPIKNIQEITIKCPELIEQKKIAAILSALDEKIATNRAINDNLQQQAMALFKEWFIDNLDILSWQKGTFSELIEKTISGDWGKETLSGSNTEMVYCLRGADIPEVRIGNKGKMPIRYILPKNFVSKQLVAGDIVVEISGGSPTQSTGRAAAISKALLARYDKGMVCTNFCKALKPIDGYSMFVYHYWQYLYDKGVFFSYENGTTGIKNLDINGFIETEPIFIAPKEMVRKFDAVCQSIFSKIYDNGLENEKLALLRDTLLPKLMSGELDVSGIDL